MRIPKMPGKKSIPYCQNSNPQKVAALNQAANYMITCGVQEILHINYFYKEIAR